jgi:type VI secretion system protein ImpH
VVYSRHFGLFGPNGPLPLCLTEYARDRIFHHGDSTFAEFCNIFHHRLTSFFFRAWADARKTVDCDRPEDRCWPQFVGSLVGIGLESLQNRDTVPDQAKLYLAGRLVQQNRNAEGLEAIIKDFFGVPTEVQTFVGRWLRLPPNSICRLGASPETGTLGATILTGTRIWNCQMHFRLRLGPMKLADLKRLLPTGPSFGRLRDWVKFYAGDEFTWDAQLVLAKEEIPDIQLGKAGQLGWTTWLRTQPFARDAEDLILNGTN